MQTIRNVTKEDLEDACIIILSNQFPEEELWLEGFELWEKCCNIWYNDGYGKDFISVSYNVFDEAIRDSLNWV